MLILLFPFRRVFCFFIVSAVEMVYAMAMEYSPPPMYFNANHPFIYFIRSNNDILFMGRFVGN